MIHGKQQILLYSLLITLSYGQAYGALSQMGSASALVAGSVESTCSYVARQVAQEVIGGSGSSVVGGGSEPIMSNVSATTIAEALKDAFDETAPSEASEVSSSGDSDTAVSKQAELREATEAVLRSWAHNRNMIQYATRAIADSKMQSALKSIQLTPLSTPSEALTTTEYANALYNTAARQQYAYFINNPEIGVILESEVEVLAPVSSNGINVALPPVSYEFSFLPKQQVYLLVSYLAENKSLSTVVQQKLSDALAGASYAANSRGAGITPWAKMPVSQKRFIVETMRAFVDQAVVKMRENYGKIQQAIAATLQAQGAAEQKAQGSSIDLFEEFKNQFNQAKDSGIFNWLKYKWSGQQNPSIEQLFIGSDLPVLKQYVEGALEVLVYDMVPYSSIVKMGESVNDLSTEFAKKCTSKDGKKLLNFMIFGGAVIGGTAAVMSDDENGIRARLDASYIAMQLKMGEKPSSSDLVKTFGELAWYSVTGKVLTLDPKKYANIVKVGKIAQTEAKGMIGAADEIHAELVPMVDRVKEAMKGISASQAYGLNFNQPIAAFIADVQKLNPDLVNPSLTEIASTMQADPRAALALQGALFDVMSNASFFAKVGWFAAPVVKAFEKVGIATTTIAASDSSASAVAQAEGVLQQSATDISGAWSDTMKESTDQVKADVQAGVITPERAIEVVAGKAAELDVVTQATAEEVRLKAAREAADQASQTKQDAQALKEQEEAAQTALSPFVDSLFDEAAKIKQQAFEEVSKSMEEMALVMSAQRNEELKAQVAMEKRASSKALFKANVSADARLFAASLQQLNMSVVTGNDVIKMLRRHSNLFKGVALESSDRKYLQGYLQGVAMFAKDSVDAGRVVQVVDVVKAIARR